MRAKRASRRNRAEASPGLPIAFAALTMLAPLLPTGALAESTHHVVQPGESLWQIARQHTGQGARWVALQQANRLPQPERIQPGQVLQIPTRLAVLPVASALVEHVQGEVLVRLPGQAGAEPLRPGMRLPEGSRLEVGTEATTRLSLADGSAVDLSPGAHVQLSRLRMDTKSEQSQTLLRMERGRVDSEVKPKHHPGSRFEIHTPSAVASVRGTRFGVAVDQGAASSDVSEGRVALQASARGHPAALLGPGQGARVGRDGRLQRADLPAAPELGALPTDFDDGDRVAFDLPAQADALTYRLRLLDASARQHVLREVSVSAPRVEWSALADGPYLLAMQSVNALGLPGRSAEHGFTVLSTPAAPLHRQPAPGSTLGGPLQTLLCTEPLQAMGYRLQVAGEAGFGKPVVDEVNRATCAFVLRLPYGHYQWRVATLAADTTGVGSTRQGPFSAPRSFAVSGTANEAPMPQGLEVDWPARVGVQYRAELASDPDFAQVLREEWLSTNQLTWPMPPNGSYYLRWQARDAQGRMGRMSVTHRIEIATGGLQTSDKQPVRTGAEAQQSWTTPAPQGR